MNHVAAAVRRRAALLWLGVTTAAAGPVTLAGPAATALVREPGGTFADLLVRGCAVAMLVATLLLWLATTEVAWQQLRRPGTCRRRVGPVRAALLAACGVAVLAGPAQAAGAAGGGHSDSDPAGTTLDGLPLPDRATGATAPTGAHEPARTRTVDVRPGDSLWAIAERALGPGAPAAEVASYWRRVHALNAAAIGPDPDLLHPGQRLRLPPTRSH